MLERDREALDTRALRVVTHSATRPSLVQSSRIDHTQADRRAPRDPSYLGALLSGGA